MFKTKVTGGSLVVNIGLHTYKNSVIYSSYSLSTLATIVADFGHNLSPKTATVAENGDSRSARGVKMASLFRLDFHVFARIFTIRTFAVYYFILLDLTIFGLMGNSKRIVLAVDQSYEDHSTSCFRRGGQDPRERSAASGGGRLGSKPMHHGSRRCQKHRHPLRL